MLTLGSGTLQVAAIDSVRGRETFRFRFRLAGKTVFYSLDDVLESWVSTETFESHRFVQDFNENDKPKHRPYEIFPDSGFFREVGRDTTYATPDDPLDDAAFFYFVRITPLEVGKTYSFDRYFRKEKNPVTIKVDEAGKDGAARRHRGALPGPPSGDRHQGDVLQAVRDAALAHRRRAAAAGADPDQVQLRDHHAAAEGDGRADPGTGASPTP